MGIGKEWGAYRGAVKEAEGIYGADRNKLPRILRLPISIAARLSAEVDGVFTYLLERLKDGNSPEEISKRNTA